MKWSFLICVSFSFAAFWPRCKKKIDLLAPFKQGFVAVALVRTITALGLAMLPYRTEIEKVQCRCRFTLSWNMNRNLALKLDAETSARHGALVCYWNFAWQNSRDFVAVNLMRTVTALSLALTQHKTEFKKKSQRWCQKTLIYFVAETGAWHNFYCATKPCFGAIFKNCPSLTREFNLERWRTRFNKLCKLEKRIIDP